MATHSVTPTLELAQLLIYEEKLYNLSFPLILASTRVVPFNLESLRKTWSQMALIIDENIENFITSLSTLVTDFVGNILVNLKWSKMELKKFVIHNDTTNQHENSLKIFCNTILVIIFQLKTNLENQLSQPNLPNLIEKLKTASSLIICNALTIETQPPDVLKQTTTFEFCTRFLINPTFYMPTPHPQNVDSPQSSSSPTVAKKGRKRSSPFDPVKVASLGGHAIKIVVLNHDDAIALYSDAQLSPQEMDSWGKIGVKSTEVNIDVSNDSCVFQQNVQVTKVTRSTKQKGNRVAGDKFCLLFCITISIQGVQHEILSYSLPFVYYVHKSQMPTAMGSIVWYRAFKTQSLTDPFAQRERVRWKALKEVLNSTFNLITKTKRKLTNDNLDYLGRKILEKTQTVELPLDGSTWVSYSTFCKQSMTVWKCVVIKESPSTNAQENRTGEVSDTEQKTQDKTKWKEVDVSPWEWFYAAMELTRDHLAHYWNKGIMEGFIGKELSHLFLLLLGQFNDPKCSDGTFMLRFSETSWGTLTVLYLQRMGSDLFVEHICPLNDCDFKSKNLSDRVHDKTIWQQVVTITTSPTPKGNVFDQQSRPGIPGYVLPRSARQVTPSSIQNKLITPPLSASSLQNLLHPNSTPPPDNQPFHTLSQSTPNELLLSSLLSHPVSMQGQASGSQIQLGQSTESQRPTVQFQMGYSEPMGQPPNHYPMGHSLQAQGTLNHFQLLPSGPIGHSMQPPVQFNESPMSQSRQGLGSLSQSTPGQVSLSQSQFIHSRPMGQSNWRANEGTRTQDLAGWLQMNLTHESEDFVEQPQPGILGYNPPSLTMITSPSSIQNQMNSTPRRSSTSFQPPLHAVSSHRLGGQLFPTSSGSIQNQIIQTVNHGQMCHPVQGQSPLNQSRHVHSGPMGYSMQTHVQFNQLQLPQSGPLSHSMHMKGQVPWSQVQLDSSAQQLQRQEVPAQFKMGHSASLNQSWLNQVQLGHSGLMGHSMQGQMSQNYFQQGHCVPVGVQGQMSLNQFQVGQSGPMGHSMQHSVHVNQFEPVQSEQMSHAMPSQLMQSGPVDQHNTYDTNQSNWQGHAGWPTHSMRQGQVLMNQCSPSQPGNLMSMQPTIFGHHHDPCQFNFPANASNYRTLQNDGRSRTISDGSSSQCLTPSSTEEVNRRLSSEAELPPTAEFESIGLPEIGNQIENDWILLNGIGIHDDDEN